VELDERLYGSDCRLVLPGGGVNWPAIRGTVFDEFVVAHTLGWWGKALMLRDRAMLWSVRWAGGAAAAPHRA
jgi:phosphatidylserine synthase 2